jgi:hypothetical protein
MGFVVSIIVVADCSQVVMCEIEVSPLQSCVDSQGVISRADLLNSRARVVTHRTVLVFFPPRRLRIQGGQGKLTLIVNSKM